MCIDDSAGISAPDYPRRLISERGKLLLKESFSREKAKGFLTWDKARRYQIQEIVQNLWNGANILQIVEIFKPVQCNNQEFYKLRENYRIYISCCEKDSNLIRKIRVMILLIKFYSTILEKRGDNSSGQFWYLKIF